MKSLTVAVTVETIAGETVSEQTPDWQEVTVTSVVCCFDSVAETGDHVVYSVTAPLIVAVAVETIAGEAVLEQMSDSQEVTVTKVVFLLDSSVDSFVSFVENIGHHVVYAVTIPLTVVVAVETIASESLSEQVLDSQEVTVTRVVCSAAVGIAEVILYIVVRSR